jgi:hypothetical protein
MVSQPLPPDTILWSDKPGYQFQIKPSPLMLLPSGFTVQRSIGNRQSKNMYWQAVHYDAAYVAAYFENHYKAILTAPGDNFRSQLCIALAPHLRGCKEYGE